MWSESFNGRRGIVSDTCHRVAATVPAALLPPAPAPGGATGTETKGAASSEEGATSAPATPSYQPAPWQMWCRDIILESGIYHVFMDLSSVAQLRACDALAGFAWIRKETLTSGKSVAITVSLKSVDFSEESHDVQYLLEVERSATLDCLMLVCPASRDEAARSLRRLKRDIFSSHTKIGLSKFRENELQWIYEESGGSADFVAFGECVAPNMWLRFVDFAHSRGLNVVAEVGPQSCSRGNNTFSEVTLTKLALQYEQPPMAVLAKVLLQLGYVVMFQDAVETDFLRKTGMLLAHPLSNRPAVLAPQCPRKWNFVVSDADMEAAVEASEELETTLFDPVANSALLNAPIRRELGYFNKLPTVG